VPDLELLDADISVYLLWNMASMWNAVDTRMADKRSHTCISKHWSKGQYAYCLFGRYFVQILVWTLVTTEFFHGSPPSLHANVGI